MMYLPSGVRLSPANCFLPPEPRPIATRYVFKTVLPDINDRVWADFEMMMESAVPVVFADERFNWLAYSVTPKKTMRPLNRVMFMAWWKYSGRGCGMIGCRWSGLTTCVRG